MKQENGDNEKQANGEKGGKLNQLWVVVGGIAGLIAIVMFLTGKDSIPDRTTCTFTTISSFPTGECGKGQRGGHPGIIMSFLL